MGGRGAGYLWGMMRRYVISGVVQGVGFRPWIARLAMEAGGGGGGGGWGGGGGGGGGGGVLGGGGGVGRWGGG